MTVQARRAKGGDSGYRAENVNLYRRIVKWHGPC